jgi:hypothetical protein
MIQDDQGRWWMVGAASGKWYVYDGQNWIAGDPTRDVARAARGDATTGTARQLKRHPVLAVLAILTLSFVFFQLATVVYSVERSKPGAWFVMIVGLIVGFYTARRLWRGHYISST